jgi:hypothetical protein
MDLDVLACFALRIFVLDVEDAKDTIMTRGEQY